MSFLEAWCIARERLNGPSCSWWRMRGSFRRGIKEKPGYTCADHHLFVAPGAGYFSLLGGTMPFSRMYSASVAYCSLSCDTLPHAKPTRVRVTGPTVNICRMLSSVSAAYA